MTRLPTGFAVLDRPKRWPRPHGGPRPEALEAPLDTLAGVGPTIRGRLAKLGLRTVGDLLLHAPFRHVATRKISELFGEGEVVIRARVGRVSVRKPRRALTIVEASVADDSGAIRATWFNQPWVADRLEPGMELRLVGSVRRGTFAVRSHETAVNGHAVELLPVYHAGEDVNPDKLRELVDAVLPQVRDLPDPLPAELRVARKLPLRGDAVLALHRPRLATDPEVGRRRLAFDELLLIQLGLARRRREREDEVAPALGAPGDLIDRYREALPFRLTDDQERAIRELDADLGRVVPMQRLLQGDVGSGKTVVALYALLRAVESGHQGALMAPTETLAEQHFLTVDEICRALGIPCALLTSSVGKRERRHAADASIVVGTHALIQAGVEWRDLAVVVVDEQHRFGVEQRSALAVGRSPHVLHMTATPIPRTLALTVYGDLAVSEISRPPAGRQPIVTSWVGAERSSDAYRRLTKHLEAGRQAYVVCPLVSESETIGARAAEQEADRLRRAELRGFRVGCMHGKLRPTERRELMAAFKAGELDVLVATTVIEVGVDVANATIMIVQEADRFGLAQLHQLRGRVGRGAEQSYCLLVSRPKQELTEAAGARLDALVRTTDGFELAEVDLELRGEGQLLGTRQAGLSDLRFTRLREDRPLLETARRDAEALVEYDGPLTDEVERLFAATATSSLA